MHQDLEALEICCKHYQTNYVDENVRKLKNKNRCQQRKLVKQEIEIYCLRNSLRHWGKAYDDMEKAYRCFLEQALSLAKQIVLLCRI